MLDFCHERLVVIVAGIAFHFSDEYGFPVRPYATAVDSTTVAKVAVFL